MLSQLDRTRAGGNPLNCLLTDLQMLCREWSATVRLHKQIETDYLSNHLRSRRGRFNSQMIDRGQGHEWIRYPQDQCLLYTRRDSQRTFRCRACHGYGQTYRLVKSGSREIKRFVSQGSSGAVMLVCFPFEHLWRFVHTPSKSKHRKTHNQ